VCAWAYVLFFVCIRVGDEVERDNLFDSFFGVRFPGKLIRNPIDSISIDNNILTAIFFSTPLTRVVIIVGEWKCRVARRVA